MPGVILKPFPFVPKWSCITWPCILFSLSIIYLCIAYCWDIYIHCAAFCDIFDCIFRCTAILFYRMLFSLYFLQSSTWCILSSLSIFFLCVVVNPFISIAHSVIYLIAFFFVLLFYSIVCYSLVTFYNLPHDICILSLLSIIYLCIAYCWSIVYFLWYIWLHSSLYCYSIRCYMYSLCTFYNLPHDLCILTSLSIIYLCIDYCWCVCILCIFCDTFDCISICTAFLCFSF